MNGFDRKIKNLVQSVNLDVSEIRPEYLKKDGHEIRRMTQEKKGKKIWKWGLLPVAAALLLVLLKVIQTQAPVRLPHYNPHMTVLPGPGKQVKIRSLKTGSRVACALTFSTGNKSRLIVWVKKNDSFKEEQNP